MRSRRRRFGLGARAGSNLETIHRIHQGLGYRLAAVSTCGALARSNRGNQFQDSLNAVRLAICSLLLTRMIYHCVCTNSRKNGHDRGSASIEWRRRPPSIVVGWTWILSWSQWPMACMPLCPVPAGRFASFYNLRAEHAARCAAGHQEVSSRRPDGVGSPVDDCRALRVGLAPSRV